ncbi:hypothetical protein ACFCWY_33655 [Streptomyces sp. NPDC056362]|uniref:hypothetical protein n=1 Tax=unclassified Streptomyces TaxID=2593676 RepID=UPI0035DC5027
MGLVNRVWPGIEEQADQIAEAACELADTTAGTGWSAAAADDALVAVDTLAAALARVDPDVREAPTAVTAATSAVRGRLGLPVDTERVPAPAATVPGAPAARTGRMPRRRGLGLGFQGILHRRVVDDGHGHHDGRMRFMGS